MDDATETYEEYVDRVKGLNVDPLPRPIWARGKELLAWLRRTSETDTVLNDEEVEKLMVDLRNVNASHRRYLVPTYEWASNCPHDVDHLEAPQPYYVGDGPEHPDEDEHHKRDEDGELFCLLSRLARCACAVMGIVPAKAN